MRAIVINFTGKDGRTAKVIFDRYGLNSDLFNHGRTNEQLINHACSNAVSAIVRSPEYGPDWTDTYTVHEVA